MSHASRHIEWCLNKANKEMEENRKLGKRPKHRGLLKIKPDIEAAKRHIEKAAHNFSAIGSFSKIGFSDWSMVAGFYCVYHCFLAIALKFGYESRNQTCTVALIEKLKEEGKLEIDEKFTNLLKYEDMDSIIEMREDYTYGVKVSIEDEKKITDMINVCKEMIDIAKNIVFV